MVKKKTGTAPMMFAKIYRFLICLSLTSATAISVAIAGRGPEESGDLPARSQSGEKPVPHQVWSPDHKSALECIFIKATEDEPGPCRLFFISRNRKTRIAIPMPSTGDLGFCHFVNILWSPDSKHFVLSDFSQGPGYADAFLYNVADVKHPLDIEKQMRKVMPQSTQQKVFSAEHVGGLYTKAHRWINTSTIDIRVEGDRESHFLWNFKTSTLTQR